MKFFQFCRKVSYTFLFAIIFEVKACENVVSEFYESFGQQNICIMQQNSISSTGVSLSVATNGSIGFLRFHGNKNVEYLPESVFETFPNLVIYDASFCSITEVYKQNFKGLSKLSWLNLVGNQIEKILNETFEGLKVLMRIDLGKKLFSF